MPTPPDALLLIAPGCAHCPTVLEALSGLLKAGRLGRLEVVNIAAHPDQAAAVGTRSVPWCRIGPFELTGLHSAAELAGWVEHAANGTGMPEYLSDLLASQQLPRVLELIRERPGLSSHLVGLIADLDTPMAVRIGVGAVFEDLAEDDSLDRVVPQLASLTRAAAPQVRADAAHYLGLSGNGDAIPYLQPLLQDEAAEVREIAAESLALLGSTANH